MSTTDADQEFVVELNVALMRALESGVDPDVIAKTSLNTAREVYEQYGAGEDTDDFVEYVVSTEFEVAEIERWLDEKDTDE